MPTSLEASFGYIDTGTDCGISRSGNLCDCCCNCGDGTCEWIWTEVPYGTNDYGATEYDWVLNNDNCANLCPPLRCCCTKPEFDGSFDGEVVVTDCHSCQWDCSGLNSQQPGLSLIAGPCRRDYGMDGRAPYYVHIDTGTITPYSCAAHALSKTLARREPGMVPPGLSGSVTNGHCNWFRLLDANDLAGFQIQTRAWYPSSGGFPPPWQPRCVPAVVGFLSFSLDLEEDTFLVGDNKFKWFSARLRLLVCDNEDFDLSSYQVFENGFWRTHIRAEAYDWANLQFCPYDCIDFHIEMLGLGVHPPYSPSPGDTAHHVGVAIATAASSP